MLRLSRIFKHLLSRLRLRRTEPRLSIFIRTKPGMDPIVRAEATRGLSARVINRTLAEPLVVTQLLVFDRDTELPEECRQTFRLRALHPL